MAEEKKDLQFSEDDLSKVSGIIPASRISGRMTSCLP